MNALAPLRPLVARSPQLREAVERAVAVQKAKQVVDGLRSDQLGLETKFFNQLLPILNSMGKLVATHAERELGQLQEKWVTPLNQAEVSRVVEHILQTADLRTWVTEQFTPRWQHWYEQTDAAVAKQLIRAGILANVRGQTALRILAQGGRRLGLLDIVGDTRAALFRAIQQGYDLGLNPRETAKLIRDIVPEGRFVNAGARYRAQLITRTETLHAQRMSSLERYRDAKLRQVMVFDGESDEICAARNGEIMTLDEAEAEMNSTHPNCVMAFGPWVG